MAKLLIVEKEGPISELLCRNLTLVGHTCAHAGSVETALALLRAGGFDLVLLDLMLSGIDGLSLLKQRPDPRIPVILVTACAALSDRIAGLDLGADGYISKPFDMLEVIARVQAALRRVKRHDAIFSVNRTTVDLNGRAAFVDGMRVELTPQEFALLETLIIHRNLALSREKLLEFAWGFHYPGETRTVDVHIQKLRRKLALTDRIKTIYKLGYRLETAR